MRPAEIAAREAAAYSAANCTGSGRSRPYFAPIVSTMSLVGVGPGRQTRRIAGRHLVMIAKREAQQPEQHQGQEGQPPEQDGSRIRRVTHFASIHSG